MSVNPAFLNEKIAFEHLDVEWREDEGTVWCGMNPHPRPCFNPGMLAELNGLSASFKRFGMTRESLLDRPHFVVFSSHAPGIFNLGGDLGLFKRLIAANDRQGLEQYAVACIDAVHRVSNGYDLPLTTISLVQGTALGGGMEGALAANVVVAERGVQMGLPEVMFNLFPGMGAFSFLSRRLGPQEAERVILSGKIWKAEELHQMGLVDILAEPGHGEAAVSNFIAQSQRKSPNSMIAMQQVRKTVNPVTYQELKDIALIWVDAAMRLRERDLKIMERLVRSQDKVSARMPLARAG